MSTGQQKPFDVGHFFDRPPPSVWSWAIPALFCAVNAALVVVIACADEGTARAIGCGAYATFAGGAFAMAQARYADRAEALRRARGGDRG